MVSSSRGASSCTNLEACHFPNLDYLVCRFAQLCPSLQNGALWSARRPQGALQHPSSDPAFLADQQQDPEARLCSGSSPLAGPALVSSALDWWWWGGCCDAVPGPPPTLMPAVTSTHVTGGCKMVFLPFGFPCELEHLPPGGVRRRRAGTRLDPSFEDDEQVPGHPQKMGCNLLQVFFFFFLFKVK